MSSTGQTKEVKGSERRKSTRLDVHASVLVAGDKESVEGTIRNMSLGGILVATTRDAKFKIGEQVNVDFSISGAEANLAARIPAEVRRCEGGSLGLSFVVSEMRVDSLLFVKSILVLFASSQREVGTIVEEFNRSLERAELAFWGAPEK